MLPLLKITTDGQEHKQGEVKDKLALQFQLNDTDQEEKLPSGGLRFDNNVAWSIVYLRKAGLLENSKRGIFHITEQGREILKTNPTKIDAKYLKQYPAFMEWQEASIKTNDPLKNEDVLVAPLIHDVDAEISYSDPSEIDPKNTPSYWIFQANPKYFNLVGAAKELKEISWKINRYKEYIQVGDIVYFWEAGNKAGIVAIGKIDSIHAAITTPNEEMKFVRGDENRDEDPTPFFGARVSIDRVLPDRIEKQKLLSDPVFVSMQILRHPQGTNFKVTYEEAQALNDLIEWPGNKLDTLDQFFEDTGIENKTLERWVNAIERKGQAILYGPPGTGKTYLAERLAQYLIGGSDGFKEVVQFHPAYAYEDFIQGIRPQPREDGTLNYPIVRGRFLEFCDRANSRQGTCVLIIDEINRANLARVFGELMYLLEYRDRDMKLSVGGTLKIPPNVRIIGTMNTADRSIALVDHALRRRFAFLALSPDYEILRRYHQKKSNNFPVEALISELTRLNNQLDRHYQVGISFFLRDNLKDEIEDIWKMEILPYLEEYFFDQPEKLDDFGWETIKGKIGL
jgi:MoxR-like ATPase